MSCEMAKPQAEHEWLTRLVGEWTFRSKASMGPDGPPMESKGREIVRSLGGLWIVCEGEGEMPGGGEAKMLLTVGYDPAKGRYLGNWVGSMMTHMFIYDGWLDDGQKTLTLETEGPSFVKPGEMATYRDVIEVVSDDVRKMRSMAKGDDGSWHGFMEAEYRRVK